MNLSTIDHLETNGLHSDEVAELHDASDYLLEAELSLSRDIDVGQRKGQLIDLDNALNVDQEAKGQLPAGQLKNWPQSPESRAKACIDDIGSELAFLKYMNLLQRKDHAQTTAA